MATSRDALMTALLDTQLSLAVLIRRAAQYGNMELAHKLAVVWKWLDREIKEIQ